MSSGVVCSLFLDGERFLDGSPGDDIDAPTALSGLSVSWGRDSTMDQPETSTCSFQVMDRRGSEAFVNLLRTGRRISVTATGIQFPDPTESTFLDPGFEAFEPTVNASLARAARTTQRAFEGTHSLGIDPSDIDRRWTVTVPPAPFEPPGTDPSAWDDIPSTHPGQSWTWQARVWVPQGVTVEVRPVLYSGPYLGAALPVGEPLTVVGSGSGSGSGSWATVGATFVPPAPSGRWVGLRLSGWPTSGARWLDVPGTWLDLDPAWTWRDYVRVFLDDVDVRAPAGGAPHEVLVFDGRITDLTAAWSDAVGGALVSVTAADFTADLENVGVGDEPWPVETMGERFERIIGLSGQDVSATIDAAAAAPLVSYQDVDNQAVVSLLRDLAESVDAVLWHATHQVTGPYLWVEDVAERPALYALTLGGDGLVHITPGGGNTEALDLSACDVLRDPVEWVQSVADVSTRTAVTWLEQGVDDDGKPTTTDRTVTVIDPVLEAAYGVRRVSVSTLLQAEADARAIATAILARTSLTGWRAGGVTVDDHIILSADPADVSMMLRLLDGTERIGLPIRLTDLPEWSPVGTPVPVYLEGGSYTYERGAWVLELMVSSAVALGASATWVDLAPAWTWEQLAPEISWADLLGVSANGGTTT